MNVVIYPYSIEHSYIKKYKKLFRYNIIYFMCYGNILPISHQMIMMITVLLLIWWTEKLVLMILTLFVLLTKFQMKMSYIK